MILTRRRFPIIRSGSGDPESAAGIVKPLSPRSLAAKILEFYPTASCLDWLTDTAKYLPAAGSAVSFAGKAMSSGQE